MNQSTPLLIRSSLALMRQAQREILVACFLSVCFWVALATCNPQLDTYKGSSWKQSFYQSDPKQAVALLEEARNNQDGNLILRRELSIRAIRLDDLIDLVNFNPTDCIESDILKDVRMVRFVMDGTLFEKYVREAAKEWESICTGTVKTETEQRIDSLKPETKKFLELFFEHDNTALDSYFDSNSAIQKLKHLSNEGFSGESEARYGQSEQKSRIELKQYKTKKMNKRATEFLVDCSEITSKFGSLAVARKNLILLSRQALDYEQYFRAYNFCKQLVSFDFSEALNMALAPEVIARASITDFGELIKSRPREKSIVLGAVFEWARCRSGDACLKSSCTNKMISSKSDLLDLSEKLRKSCQLSLALTDNLLWLREASSEQNVQNKTLTERALKYLRGLDYCKEYLDIDTNTIEAFFDESWATYSTSARPIQQPTIKQGLRRLVNLRLI